MTLRTCSRPGCPALVERGYCTEHASSSPRNHHGVSRHERGHGTDYERIRRTLVGQPCHWCPEIATTADYAVPVSRGGTLEDLVPACARCNYARGARGGVPPRSQRDGAYRLPSAKTARRVQSTGDPA